ncbi:MAG: VWA domain-containing protein [Elusimicrobia bacterium]|nr:VWA domain-containing protein [Elusimicrobiota bacterium]
MTFKHPYLLGLIPPILVLALMAGSIARARLAAIKLPVDLPGQETLKTLLYRFLPLWARTLALILLALALARPQKIEKGDIPPAEGIDIMMCMDTSYSMVALDFDPYNRLDAAKNAAADFVRKRGNDRIGMVVFGGLAVLACPLTLDYQSLLEFIDSTRINMTNAEGTAIGDALITSVNHLKNSKAKSKVIILLTDGRSNVGIITDPVMAARTAQAYDIKIYAIGTATKGKAKFPTGNPFQPYATMDDDLDEPTLLELAARTGGEFYRAENYAELQQIYDRIDSLEKTKFEVKSHTNYTDVYLVFLAPAMALLLLLFILEKTFLRTIP